MPKTSVKKLKFETALDELESLVDSVDSGDIPLDQLISQFERGAELIKHCRSLLTDAETRIKRIEIETNSEKSINELEDPASLDQNPPASSELPADDDIELF